MAMNINEGKELDFDLNVAVSEPNNEGNEGNVETLDLNASASDDNNSDDSDPCLFCYYPLVSNTDDSPTVVTLKCGDQFHLDCIGSVFNARNMMECPHCYQIEPGQWRFANDWVAEFLADEEEEEEDEEDDEEEENIDLGIFTDLSWRTEMCPFTDLGQHHPCEYLSIWSPTIVSNEPTECIYVECLYTIPQPSPSTGDIPNPNGLPVEPLLPPSNRPPIVPVNRLYPNKRIFWSVLEPGVIRGRHYYAHPFFDHSPLCRSDGSVINAPTAPNPGSSSVANSSVNNTSQVSSNLDELSAPVLHADMFPNGPEQLTRGISNSLSGSNGSNLVNNNGFNRLNIWEHEPFLDLAQQQHVESEFYRFIYGDDDGGESTTRGNENNNGGGNGGNGGSFGGSAGGGNGDGTGTSGGATS